MNGHILHGTDIAVDYWKVKGTEESYVHFLTHLHGDHIVGLTSSWTKPIYCSEITAMLLEKRHGVSRHLLNIVPLNDKIIVTSKSGPFTVMAFDANHCPGALMFYFQGSFGSIFYCGDFRGSTGLINDCCPVAKDADILYLDNTFCDKMCDFPSRSECFIQILNIIRRHPKHEIIILMHNLGKECMLGELGARLNETIVVSPVCYKLCCELFDTNVFTTPYSPMKSRIWAVPMNMKYEAVKRLNDMSKETIIIIPTAKFTGLKRKPLSHLLKVFVVPYSDHSNYTELHEFVRAMRPKCIKPIMEKPRDMCGESLTHRADMSCFDALLSRSLCPDQNLNSKEQDSALLINNPTQSGPESCPGSFADNRVCLSNKRVFKRFCQDDPEDGHVSKASAVTQDEAGSELASLLTPLLMKKANVQLKKIRNSRKRIRSKIQGVVYTEEDETTTSSCLPSRDQNVKKSKLSKQKVDVESCHKKATEKGETESQPSSKKPHLRLSLAQMGSDNKHDDEMFTLQQPFSSHANEAILDGQLSSGEGNQGNSVFVISDVGDIDSCRDENMNSEEKAKECENLGKIKSPKVAMCGEKFTSHNLSLRSEALEEVTDIEVSQVLPEKRLTMPTVSSTSDKTKISSGPLHLSSLCEGNCDPQATDILTLSYFGVSNTEEPLERLKEDRESESDIPSVGLRLCEANPNVTTLPENEPILSDKEAYKKSSYSKEGDESGKPHCNMTTIIDSDSMRTKGHIMPGTDILVDYWNVRDIPDTYVHFLTNPCRDHTVGLTSSWTRPIYCSEITALLLVKCHGISRHLIRILPLNEKVIVSSKSGPFNVMAFDANHCPGAIMLHFQGTFGRIFYCGSFRSSADVIADCCPLAKNVDTLYLDNTFCDEMYTFPPRRECFSQILNIIRQHPKQKVMIGIDEIGSESMLGEVGVQLNETIVVPQGTYKLCRTLFDSNVFTTPQDIGRSRIWAFPIKMNDRREVSYLKKADKNAIFILPTAVLPGQFFKDLPRVYVVPYSNHSSYPELQEFVSAMRPMSIKPIVTSFLHRFGKHLCQRRADMSCFYALLSGPRCQSQNLDIKVENTQSSGDGLNAENVSDVDRNKCFHHKHYAGSELKRRINVNATNGRKWAVEKLIANDVHDVSLVSSPHGKKREKLARSSLCCDKEGAKDSCMLHFVNKDTKKLESCKKIKSVNILVANGGEIIKPGNVKEEELSLISSAIDLKSVDQCSLRIKRLPEEILKISCAHQCTSSSGQRHFEIVNKKNMRLLINNENATSTASSYYGSQTISAMTKCHVHTHRDSEHPFIDPPVDGMCEKGVDGQLFRPKRQAFSTALQTFLSKKRKLP